MKKNNNKIITGKSKSVLVELKLQTERLTKKDIATWRRAWQLAIDIENPNRYDLYMVYNDIMVDNHLAGCISQRKGFTTKKTFRIVDRAGKENTDMTNLFFAPWFKTFMDLTLDSVYFGHSLIQFGNVMDSDTGMCFENVELVPRQNVIPEYGVFIKDVGDTHDKGIPYREGVFSRSVIEVGEPRNLGLLLKVAHQCLPKKNMMAYWDVFGEIFGMPLRFATTSSRDKQEIDRTEKAVRDMGAAGYAILPEGTDIQIVESSRGDAFNVYDKRIERCNSEISKAILGQTMTIDNGASLSQSQVHLDVFKNLIDQDSDLLRDTVNWKLIPFMIAHGFPLQGYHFEWDESPDYTPEEQISIEDMLLRNFDVDPEYFENKYNVKILGKKEFTDQQLRLRNGKIDFFA
jgi:hypothetical protein